MNPEADMAELCSRGSHRCLHDSSKSRSSRGSSWSSCGTYKHEMRMRAASILRSIARTSDTRKSESGIDCMRPAVLPMYMLPLSLLRELTHSHMQLRPHTADRTGPLTAMGLCSRFPHSRLAAGCRVGGLAKSLPDTCPKCVANNCCYAGVGISQSQQPEAGPGMGCRRAASDIYRVTPSIA